ncbi:hypothetical protein V8C37DRAFT_420120 [Trichoderma ceciliae]
MSALPSDSHETLYVPKDQLSKNQTSYHRIVRRLRLKMANLSVPRPIPTSTALVSAAMISAAPIFKFEARPLLFVPSCPPGSPGSPKTSNSVSQPSFITAPEVDEVRPSTPQSSSVEGATFGVSRQSRPSYARAKSVDESFSRRPSSTGPGGDLRIDPTKEALDLTPNSQPTSPASPWLAVPPSVGVLRRSSGSRGRQPSTVSRSRRNLSQDSRMSQTSLRTMRSVGSQVSIESTDEFEYILQAMDDLVDERIKQLRGPLPFSTYKSPKSPKSPKNQCREALASFQDKIRAVKVGRGQDTDAADDLRYRSLLHLYDDVKLKLVWPKSYLSLEHIGDPYGREFCERIVEYERRLDTYTTQNVPTQMGAQVLL